MLTIFLILTPGLTKRRSNTQLLTSQWVKYLRSDRHRIVHCIIHVNHLLEFTLGECHGFQWHEFRMFNHPLLEHADVHRPLKSTILLTHVVLMVHPSKIIFTQNSVGLPVEEVCLLIELFLGVKRLLDGLLQQPVTANCTSEHALTKSLSRHSRSASTNSRSFIDRAAICHARKYQHSIPLHGSMTIPWNASCQFLDLSLLAPLPFQPVDPATLSSDPSDHQLILVFLYSADC